MVLIVNPSFFQILYLPLHSISEEHSSYHMLIDFYIHLLTKAIQGINYQLYIIIARTF